MHLTSNGSQIPDSKFLSWPPLEEVTVQSIHYPVLRPSCFHVAENVQPVVLTSLSLQLFVACKTWGRAFSMFSRIHFLKESGLLVFPGVFSPCVFTSQRRVVCSIMSHHIHTISSCFSKILRIQILRYPHENWYTYRQKYFIS